jgi:hypothetical protein
VTSETKEDPDAGAGTAQLANGDGCPLKADVLRLALGLREVDQRGCPEAWTTPMWLGRAHSVGHLRQHLNFLGFALAVNSLALLEHRARTRALLAAA